MNKLLCLKMLLCCVLATTSFEHEYTQAQPGEIESVVADEIGRENPFEQIGTTGFGGDFALISGTVRNIVHLLQEKTNLEIIASPKVMVVSGRKAEIRAVDEIPFNELIQTSEGGQLSATSFKDVGVTLKVTATLTEDNEIFLQVDTEQKVETGASETGVPVVAARIANTSLLLEDGQVVAIGGLRQKVTTELVDQIPFLGDLPIVGFLFRSTRTVEINSELVVFLSPHIYKDEPLTEEQMNRFNELKGYPPLEIPRPHKDDLLPLVEMLQEPNDRSN